MCSIPVYFVKSEFQGANFSEARFRDDVDFSGSFFHDQANFSRAVFHKRANFSETQFHTIADFSKVNFKGNAYFKESNFPSPTSQNITPTRFDQAIFKIGRFTGRNEKKLDLKGVSFRAVDLSTNSIKN
jgi:uncharacterized protein YjbI with pentapeptide repeats